MIYFTPINILTATLSFFILGCFFGGLYNSFDYVFIFLKRMMLLPKISYLKYKKCSIPQYKSEQNKIGVFVQIADFSFVFLLGTSYILFTYLFLDGCFRIFSLFFLFLGYMLSLRMFSSLFSITIRRIILLLLSILERVFFFILFPFFFLLDKIKITVMPIIYLISNKYETKRFKTLLKRKKTNIEKIY